MDKSTAATNKMKRHPLSACFPQIPESDLADMAASIKAIGQQVPGTLCDGMVLEGWQRYEACQIAGVKFKAKSLPKDTDPVAFVMALNDNRRHMTANQRAASAVRVDNWKRSQNRMGGTECPPPATEAQLAEEAGVSERTIRYARAAEAAGKGDDVLRGTTTARAAVEAPKPKPRKSSGGDTNLAKRVLELEADLEKANAQIESLQEALTDYEALKSDNEHMIAIIAEDDDNRIVAALDTIKKLTAQIRVLEERIRSLQGERNMAIKAARRKAKA